MDILISIIIPCYNAEKFIKETIESVIVQTYSNWELIIVDDGSSDESIAIISTYLNDKRIKLISQKNSGVSVARNSGATYAKGNFLCFLDADDVWERNFIQESLFVLTKHKSAIMANCDSKAIDQNSNILKQKFEAHEGDVFRDVLLFKSNRVTFPSSIMVKVEEFKTLGGFDVSLSNVADKYFYLSIAKQGEIVRINKQLLLYRIHSNNMHSNVQLMERDYLLFMLKIEQKFNLDKELKISFNKKIYYILYRSMLKEMRLSKSMFYFYKYLLLK